MYLQQSSKRFFFAVTYDLTISTNLVLVRATESVSWVLNRLWQAFETYERIIYRKPLDHE